ncbi:MAG: MotA/TolQ/ExbB proton channel family protein [Helicobacteraceae bacterium]|jgi:biopolymer transport protein ExbB/TolQ|nr:MotA/TolQ/ExbB proton channel family protein [Helicobacteraceae bacterium]
MENFNDFISQSHGVTLTVLALLSVYFILINWVFFYRFFSVNSWIDRETLSLEQLLMGGANVTTNAYLHKFISSSSKITREIFDLGMFSATKESTKGLSYLSVVASTSPFIGLFGTVVSILDTFDDIGGAGGMNMIAAGVSDALIATAGGIFVAIFAYTYHQILKRRAFELNGLIRMQRDAVLSRLAEES